MSKTNEHEIQDGWSKGQAVFSLESPSCEMKVRKWTEKQFKQDNQYGEPRFWDQQHVAPCRDRITLLAEYQSPETQIAAVDGAYRYTQLGQPYSRSYRSTRIPARLFRYRVVKRCLDVGLVLASAPVLLPILAIISVVVLMSSPGPIFYSHRRIRRNGEFFSMWKFRTMCQNSAEVLEQHLSRHPQARAEWNTAHKLQHDPRVTAVGAFLRRYSLDELPQMWNVLTGQMSLVGPRPIVAAEVEKYGDWFGCYCRVKPGLTGLWQVSGRSTLSYDERVALDREYVEGWSLRRDTGILLRTVLAVVNQDGAF